MERLPIEILYGLYDFCDLYSILTVRSLCYRLANAVDDYLPTRISLHLWNEYAAYVNDPTHLRLDRVASFIRYHLRGLKILNLENVPVHISLSSLIKLASAAPNVRELNISTTDSRPSIDSNAVYALRYFRKLQSLTMHRWGSVDRMGRGCVHHECLIPPETLSELREWKVCGAARALGHTLNFMRQRDLILPKIESVCFSFDTACTHLEAPVIWFLSHHPTIRVFQLCNSIFAGRQALHDLYQTLQRLPVLETVVLSDCWICDGMDQATLSAFLQNMREKNVTVDGFVRSFRYSPDAHSVN